MPKWYETFNGQFWIMIAGMTFAFLGILAKSKCTACRICGMEIERDVEAEVALARHERQSSGHSLSPTPRLQTLNAHIGSDIATSSHSMETRI